MKHQNLIDKFRASRHENDGCCDIIYLPSFDGSMFNSVLPEPYTDIIYASLSPECFLEFLISSPDDREQAFVSIGYFPFSLQKKIYNYLFSKK